MVTILIKLHLSWFRANIPVLILRFRATVLPTEYRLLIWFRQKVYVRMTVHL